MSEMLDKYSEYLSGDVKFTRVGNLVTMNLIIDDDSDNQGDELRAILKTIRRSFKSSSSWKKKPKKPLFKVGDYVVHIETSEIVKVIDTPHNHLLTVEHHNQIKKANVLDAAYKPLKIDNVENFIRDYVAKYDSDWSANWFNFRMQNFYIFKDHIGNKYHLSDIGTVETIGAIYMSQQCAKRLVDILNKA